MPEPWFAWSSVVRSSKLRQRYSPLAARPSGKRPRNAHASRAKPLRRPPPPRWISPPFAGLATALSPLLQAAFPPAETFPVTFPIWRRQSRCSKAGSHRFSEILHAAKFLRGQNSASGRVIPATLSEGMTRFPQNDPNAPRSRASWARKSEPSFALQASPATAKDGSRLTRWMRARQRLRPHRLPAKDRVDLGRLFLRHFK